VQPSRHTSQERFHGQRAGCVFEQAQQPAEAYKDVPKPVDLCKQRVGRFRASRTRCHVLARASLVADTMLSADTPNETISRLSVHLYAGLPARANCSADAATCPRLRTSIACSAARPVTRRLTGSCTAARSPDFSSIIHMFQGALVPRCAVELLTAAVPRTAACARHVRLVAKPASPTSRHSTLSPHTSWMVAYLAAGSPEPWR
jgi:hypothetical protein